MVEVVQPALVYHVWTTVVVELASMTNRLQSMVTRARYMQHAEANHLGPIVLCTIRSLISYEPIWCKKNCKRSYVSGKLRENETLVAGKVDNSTMVGSAGRYTQISIRGSFTSMGQEEFFLAMHQLSSNIWLWFIKNSGSTMIEGYGSASIFTVKWSLIGWLSGAGSCLTLSLLQCDSNE